MKYSSAEFLLAFILLGCRIGDIEASKLKNVTAEEMMVVSPGATTRLQVQALDREGFGTNGVEVFVSTIGQSQIQLLEGDELKETLILETKEAAAQGVSAHGIATMVVMASSTTSDDIQRFVIATLVDFDRNQDEDAPEPAVLIPVQILGVKDDG